MQMKEEDTLYVEYNQTNQSGKILSPNHSQNFNNSHGETKTIINSLPKTFWLNLVYIPSTITATNGLCDKSPFLLYNGTSTSSITTKHGCGSVHFNSEVPAGTWRTIDVIITGTERITIAVKPSGSPYGAFKLYYSSKYKLT